MDLSDWLGSIEELCSELRSKLLVGEVWRIERRHVSGGGEEV